MPKQWQPPIDLSAQALDVAATPPGALIEAESLRADESLNQAIREHSKAISAQIDHVMAQAILRGRHGVSVTYPAHKLRLAGEYVVTWQGPEIKEDPTVPYGEIHTFTNH